MVSAAVGCAFRLALKDSLWIAAPVSMAVALLAMQLTRTVHPPGAQHQSFTLSVKQHYSGKTFAQQSLIINQLGSQLPISSLPPALFVCHHRALVPYHGKHDMTTSCTTHVCRQLLTGVSMYGADRRKHVCRQGLDRCMHVCRRCHSHYCFPSKSTPTLGRLQFHPCDVGGLIWTDCHCNSCEQSARQKALSYILVWKQALGKQQTIGQWQVHHCCGCGSMYRCMFELICKNCIVW